ncbi:hypothetical protein A2803_02180 [Candidatus Woesebacteria bacterium RIFCSPHIGHO2_01_FULL_44_21]|uniref:Nudix hydrolase domain-containing protein n=1 Tax=Candidatus Woesebacteria bacterium RIFCSPHIGHO2_01_FULL_44_21 TaxID=1802503 RepID=A0A1F7YW61_9BACT|nr:MAG: hypothetical protein A2803_02180 [Candidatus Woesebacteria bacterium RIFCSPHIGHO2_01_FULL_44_21]
MNSSFALIFWNDKILLFHRDDIPTIPHPDCWQLPGGQSEKGETPIKTLKRELLEEVSYIPKNITFLGKMKTEIATAHLYLSFVSDAESKRFEHGPGEGQEIGFFTLDEALKLKLTPALRSRFSGFYTELTEAMKKRLPQIA